MSTTISCPSMRRLRARNSASVGRLRALPSTTATETIAPWRSCLGASANSATIYLTTGLLGTEKVLWTVDIASAFRQTSTKRIDLAALGLDVQDLQQFEQRIVVAGRTISILKSVPPRRRDAIEPLCAAGSPRSHTRWLLSDDGLDGRYRHGSNLTDQLRSSYRSPRDSEPAPDEDLRYEIVASIAEVRAKTSTRTRTFAYPNGSPADYDERAKRLLEASGVSAAVSTIGGLEFPSYRSLRVEARHRRAGHDVRSVSTGNLASRTGSAVRSPGFPACARATDLDGSSSKRRSAIASPGALTSHLATGYSRNSTSSSGRNACRPPDRRGGRPRQTAHRPDPDTA